MEINLSKTNLASKKLEKETSRRTLLKNYKTVEKKTPNR